MYDRVMAWAMLLLARKQPTMKKSIYYKNEDGGTEIIELNPEEIIQRFGEQGEITLPLVPSADIPNPERANQLEFQGSWYARQENQWMEDMQRLHEQHRESFNRYFSGADPYRINEDMSNLMYEVVQLPNGGRRYTIVNSTREIIRRRLDRLMEMPQARRFILRRLRELGFAIPERNMNRGNTNYYNNITYQETRENEVTRLRIHDFTIAEDVVGYMEMITHTAQQIRNELGISNEQALERLEDDMSLSDQRQEQLRNRERDRNEFRGFRSGNLYSYQNYRPSYNRSRQVHPWMMQDFNEIEKKQLEAEIKARNPVIVCSNCGIDYNRIIYKDKCPDCNAIYSD